MKPIQATALLLLVLLACSPGISNEQSPDQPLEKVSDIPAPQGFVRDSMPANSFGGYLQRMTIKVDEPVLLHDGSKKYNQNLHFATLPLDVGKKDLQQCADATMRLRAEYLFAGGMQDKIGFHFTSGHHFSWKSYAEGLRPVIEGNNVRFVKKAGRDTSYKAFRNYMDIIFTYCGTASMIKDVTAVTGDVQVGDILLQRKQPYGHAMMVMDVVRNEEGHFKIILAQSYMPAQTIHIVKNRDKPGESPWIAFNNHIATITPEWIFPEGSLYRWK